MSRIEELEKEIELTKQLIELEEKLQALRQAVVYPAYPTYPVNPPPYNPWFYQPTITS